MFTYRTKGQPTQWLRLGDVDGLGLAKARKLAGAHRHAIDVEGRDPAAEARAAAEPKPEPPPPPKAFSVGDLCDLYVTFAKGRKRSWKKDAEKLDKYIRPAWGTLPAKEITRTHVHELLDGIAAGGRTVGVNRVQAVVSSLFSLAVDRGLVGAHPVSRMKKRFKEKARTRVLTDKEIRSLETGLLAAGGPGADVLRLRLRLGQRGGEIMAMRWIDIDLEAKVWTIPAEHAKNGRAHMLPLPPSAASILQTHHEAAPKDTERVFPEMSDNDPAYRALSSLRPAGAEWKDMRRTVATRLAALGFGEATIGRVLNHARVTVTARHYNQHPYWGEMKLAFDAWDRELARIIADEPKPAAHVVPLAGRR
jgi:integrase